MRRRILPAIFTALTCVAPAWAALVAPNISSSFDVGYSGGGTQAQGFSLPVARVSLDQEISSAISGRFSVGQAREYTGALLPTLLPIDAYVTIRSRFGSGPVSHVSWKVGMFNPQFTPWWTPNLQDLPYLPSYNLVDQYLYLSRELGVELQYAPVSERSLFFAGVYNGSGIFAQNANNSRAYTLGGRWRWDLGGSDLEVGVSGLDIAQSDSTSVNYRSHLLLTAFVDWEIPAWNLFLAVQGFAGHFEDVTNIGNPSGGAVFLRWEFSRLISAFFRVEQMWGYAQGDGTLSHFELGPVIDWSPSIQTFLTYSQLTLFGADAENTGMIRTRISFGP